jgi:hypothetical protein
MTACSSNNRAKPRQQFFHLEGLWQIVGGTGNYPFDTLAPTLEHGEAVQIR